MQWFKRNKVQPPIVVETPVTSRVEVELHKGASEKAAQKARDVNEHLKDLYVENGFTLKIYIAAGGHQPKKSGKK
jgi:3-methyladenine DNA glycosylase Mpg